MRFLSTIHLKSSTFQIAPPVANTHHDTVYLAIVSSLPLAQCSVLSAAGLADLRVRRRRASFVWPGTGRRGVSAQFEHPSQ